MVQTMKRMRSFARANPSRSMPSFNMAPATSQRNSSQRFAAPWVFPHGSWSAYRVSLGKRTLASPSRHISPRQQKAKENRKRTEMTTKREVTWRPS